LTEKIVRHEKKQAGSVSAIVPASVANGKEVGVIE
jgi:hypothetical protein